MNTDMAIQDSALAVKADKMFKVPNTRNAQVGEFTALQPPVQPPRPEPFIATLISPPLPLNPIVKYYNEIVAGHLSPISFADKIGCHLDEYLDLNGAGGESWWKV